MSFEPLKPVRKEFREICVSLSHNEYIRAIAQTRSIERDYLSCYQFKGTFEYTIKHCSVDTSPNAQQDNWGRLLGVADRYGPHALNHPHFWDLFRMPIPPKEFRAHLMDVYELWWNERVPVEDIELTEESSTNEALITALVALI